MQKVFVFDKSGYVDLDECVDGVYTVFMEDHTIYYAQLDEIVIVPNEQKTLDIKLNDQVFAVAVGTINQSDSKIASQLANQCHEKGFSKKVKNFLGEFGITAPRWNKQQSLVAITDFSKEAIYGI